MEAELGLAPKRKRTVEPAYGPSPSLKATGVKPGQVNYGPIGNGGAQSQVNYNQPMPWGPMGAPADFHPSVGLATPASNASMAMGPPGWKHPGPGMAFPGTPGTPPGAVNPIDPNALGLGPLSKQLLAGGHPITAPAQSGASLGLAGAAIGPQQQSPRERYAGNMDASHFGGATPGMVADSRGQRPGFLAPPTPEGGPVIRNVNPKAISPGARGLAANDPKRLEEESRVLGLADARVSGLGPNQKSAYDSRMITRGQNMEQDRPSDLALANRKSYKDRRSAAATEHKTALGGLNANQFRAKQRADAENASADRLFADKHPDAAARMKLGQGQLAQAGQQAKDTNLFRRDQLSAQERMATERNKTSENVAGLGLAKAGIDPKTGKPIDTSTPEKKAETAENIPTNLPKEEYAARVAASGAGKETQERLISQQGRKGYFSRLFGGLDQPNQAPVSEAMGSVLGLSGSYNPLARIGAAGINTPELSRVPDKAKVSNEKLKESASDSPAIKKAKADLRARRAAGKY